MLFLLPRPCLFANRCYFECADGATMREAGNNSDGRKLDVAGSCPTATLRACSERNARNALLFRENFGFPENAFQSTCFAEQLAGNVGLELRNRTWRAHAAAWNSISAQSRPRST